jgi:large subunit ribosomal protein L17
MIHRRKGRKLSRTHSHRASLLANLSVALIKNKKIRTTLAKAKELRVYIEPMITKSRKAFLSKDDKPESGVHQRREVNKYLQDRTAVKTLFDEIAPKVIDRNGGYTRVLKMGRRLGDGAELALIELVDYNMEQAKTEAPAEETTAKGKTKGKSKSAPKGEVKAKTKSTKTAATKTKKTETKAETKTETTKTKGRKKKEAAE